MRLLTLTSIILLPFLTLSGLAFGQDRMNDTQVIGSHNSYKIGIEPAVMALIAAKSKEQARSLEYEHLPMPDQLSLGLRKLELDVYHDPEGGRFTSPAALGLLDSQGIKHLPYDEEGKLKEKGMKLFHVQDIDFRSHQLLFTDALAEILEWSNEHPSHHPIYITLNLKESTYPGFTPALPFDEGAMDSLELEINTVIPQNKLIRPDDVRGDFASLESAILEKGWPLLSEVQGKIMFILDAGTDKTELYLSLYPQLEGATIFANVEEGNPAAAVRIINNPETNQDYIQSLVKKGYIVRTRSDEGTKQARDNDYSQFELAKSSGAHIISTDYYIPSELFESSYIVNFGEGKYERLNPLRTK
ncbi:phosphatidylinositol-specific phospholipase C1-like protein [Echinicola pacifica]|nr:phosphatidylinositol-specific phospholipase C1-like protein [Echinicola pacifica]